MKALVTGATGFIGQALLARLEQPSLLVRNVDSARARFPDAQLWQWDSTAAPPGEAFAGVDTVFHLAGETVAQRWSTTVKERIRKSRVDGTRQLVAAMADLERRPRVLVSASGVGVYGDCGDTVLEEDSPAGDDFLAGVSREWEAEARAAEELGVRVVLMRISVVLGRGGGALEKMLLPFKLGGGATLGSGRQWFPWIHVDDMVGLLLHAATCEDLRGPVNAVAPGVVTNREFTKSLGRALGRPAFLWAPEFVLRIAMGEMAAMVLASTRATPRRALDSGYEFRFPELGGALREIVG